MNVTALSTLKKQLDIGEETIIFVKLITDWFKMMNVRIAIQPLTCGTSVVSRGYTTALVSRSSMKLVR